MDQLLDRPPDIGDQDGTGDGQGSVAQAADPFTGYGGGAVSGSMGTLRCHGYGQGHHNTGGETDRTGWGCGRHLGEGLTLTGHGEGRADAGGNDDATGADEW